MTAGLLLGLALADIPFPKPRAETRGDWVQPRRGCRSAWGPFQGRASPPWRRGARWGGLAARRGQRWRGPAETRRKRELSAGECRGRPRRRGATGKDVSPLPLHGSLPAGEYLAHEGTMRARGRPARMAQGCPHPIRGAPLRSTGGVGPASPAKPLQQFHPSLEHGQRGCIPTSPGRAACSPPLALVRGWAGKGSFLPSLGMPRGSDGAMGAGGRTSRQHEAGGRCQPTPRQHPFPATTTAAPAAV